MMQPPLPEDQINRLLDLMIPASNDGRMPAAASLDLMGRLPPPQTAALLAGLAAFNQQVQEAHQCRFDQLGEACQRQWIDKPGGAVHPFLKLLGQHLLCLYYQAPQCVEGLGLACRAPFPDGHALPDIDLDLLEPVFLRGKIYRDI